MHRNERSNLLKCNLVLFFFCLISLLKPFDCFAREGFIQHIRKDRTWFLKESTSQTFGVEVFKEDETRF